MPHLLNVSLLQKEKQVIESKTQKYYLVEKILDWQQMVLLEIILMFELSYRKSRLRCTRVCCYRDTRAEEGVIGTKNGRQRMTSSEIESLGFHFLVLFADYTERPTPLLFTPNFATVNLNCRNHHRHFYIIATVIHNRRPNHRHIVIFATVSHNRRNTRRNIQAMKVPP
ncbi:hypothetical protein Fmac_008149 [Flemingia macrophylla]|uniref:Uncharacterized protein n=1 Tax=Flemingia macrophylla TaxID=520843 RepID=A0ABD1MWN5_9FABA